MLAAVVATGAAAAEMENVVEPGEGLRILILPIAQVLSTLRVIQELMVTV
jgi:hypothetical protein